MKRPVNYKWHLRRLMAERGMFNTTAIRPLLAERGVNLSASQVYRLVTEKPERLNVATLVTLVEILGCTMDALIEVVPANGAAGRIAAGDKQAPRSAGRNSDVGTRKPVRAKVIDPNA